MENKNLHNSQEKHSEIKNIDKFNKLKEKLSSLLKQKRELQLRQQANIENIKKKSEHTIHQIKQENLKNIHYEISKTLKYFDKISKISQENNLDNQSIVKGIQLIQHSILNNLTKINVLIKNNEF